MDTETHTAKLYLTIQALLGQGISDAYTNGQHKDEHNHWLYKHISLWPQRYIPIQKRALSYQLSSLTTKAKCLGI